MPAASPSAQTVARPPNRLNISAISAAPTVWPRSRAVPSMPLAPPLRSRGAEVMMTRLLGDWNRPNPAPHSAMRQMMSTSPGTAKTEQAKQELRRYFDSGQYQRDLAMVAAQARVWVEQRAAQRVAGERLAVVFDIDETLLSNWPEITGTDFAYIPAVWEAWEAEAKAEAIGPVRDVYLTARRLGVEVIVLSDRREHERAITEKGLRAGGYGEYAALILKLDESKETAAEFKSAQRRRLAGEGHVIIANIGDQDSDLSGGFAERAFKLPNPFYLVK